MLGRHPSQTKVALIVATFLPGPGEERKVMEEGRPPGSVIPALMPLDLPSQLPHLSLKLLDAFVLLPNLVEPGPTVGITGEQAGTQVVHLNHHCQLMLC